MIVILYQNGTEIKRGLASKIYPVKNMGVVDTLDDNLEWKILVEGVRPNVSEIENLVRAEVDNDTTHDTYTHLKQIDVVYTKERKSDAELTQLIKNAKRNANESVHGFDVDRNELLILAIYGLIRLTKGQSVPAKAQAIATIFENKALKILANSNNLDAKLNDLANITDINSGFDNG